MCIRRVLYTYMSPKLPSSVFLYNPTHITGVQLCSCENALLDSPLALASHSSAHLLARDPLLARPNYCPSNADQTTGINTSQPNGIGTTLDPVENESDAANPSDRTELSTKFTVASSIRSTSDPTALATRFRCVFHPNPGSHIPCSLDVYRHVSDRLVFLYITSSLDLAKSVAVQPAKPAPFAVHNIWVILANIFNIIIARK